MNRLTFAILFFVLAAPLSGCGIKGDLKTPPPLWGDEAAAETAEDSADLTADAEAEETDPFTDEEDEDDVGYGIDVADNP